MAREWSKSVMEMGVMKGLKAKAATTLRTSTQWDMLQKIDPSMPSTKFRKMQVDMTKGQAALYIQLRTGHAPLNKHLHRMKAINSPICTGCSDAHESVEQFLLDCPKTARLRAKLTATLGREARSIRTLLSHPKALKPLMAFIGKTKRFGEVYGTMILPEPAVKTKRKEG